MAQDKVWECRDCGSDNIIPVELATQDKTSRIKIIREVALDFSDVLIVPQQSFLTSRSEVNLIRKFEFLYSPRTISCTPIVAANMLSVCNSKVARKMVERNMLACLPKTLDYNEFCEDEYIIQSVGLYDEPHPNAVWICLDVPTAYLDVVVTRTEELRETRPDSILIVGNVVTKPGVEKLIQAGADVVKIGIGSGSACSTRLISGVGYPQLSAIKECSEAANNLGGMIMSDGGCQVPGDIAKSLVFADFVMLGGMLAGHGPDNGTGFYGMSSERANNEFAGGLKGYRTSKGWEMKLKDKGPIENTLQDILGGLRSACTYVGASSIEELQQATFIRVNNQANTSLWEHRV